MADEAPASGITTNNNLDCLVLSRMLHPPCNGKENLSGLGIGAIVCDSLHGQYMQLVVNPC